MKGELLFLLIAVLIAISVVGLVQLHKHWHRIKRIILNRLIRILQSYQHNPGDPGKFSSEQNARLLTEEEESKAELQRLQGIIEDRKQVAQDTDISYHLWSFYENHFRNASELPGARPGPDGEWYDVKILKASTKNNLNEFEFEMKGARYRFLDDEESQSWAMNVKVFGLFLYDDSGRCLIEIPMKVRVDKTGRRYSILPGGPRAFLPGDWTREFISTKLKHQRMRNQEIRAQKHEERLSEIEDLKDRFGIWE